MMQLFTIAMILLFGIFLGGVGVACFYRFRWGALQAIGQQVLERAEAEAERFLKESRFKIKEREVELHRNNQEWRGKEKEKLHAYEDRLKDREDKLERRMGLVEKKLSDIEKREAIIQARKGQLEEERRKTADLKKSLLTQLEQVSGLTGSEAKELLLQRIEQDVRNEAANYTRRARKEAEEEAERAACTIISTAINRMAISQVSETTVTTVPIPHDEMKGRIIGREGRNIRTLERATGVNFLIDDTPGVVVISGFDPIRKHVAKVALQDLIHDGRIHPTRIEETVEKARGNTAKEIRKFGEDAALRAGAVDLHPELIQLLGKLKFRYSYGQNVLEHSLEVSYILGIMAAELGLNISMAKRIGLLHDIGKAVSHEVEGTHALIGLDLALKNGESPEVANGIGCHHQEIPPTTPEGALCGAADTLSASRPGARIEAVEEYVKRLRSLEEIVYNFPGVDRVYATQAGREVHVIVMPEMIDDNGLIILARDISKEVENKLTYPGKIKVVIIREKRAVEYAV